MIAILLLTLVFVIATYIYVRWMQVKQYWKKRGAAYIPPHPIFGSLTYLQRENPGPWFRRVYDHFKKPYVGVWIFWRPGLIVNSEQIARNILIRDQANFRKRLATSGTTDPVGQLNLFTLNDPLWSVIRKRLSVLFTSSKLRGIQTLITEKSKQLIERIDRERQKAEPINIKEVLIDYSTDVIGTSSFGVESSATITGESELKNVTKEYTKYGLFRALSWCCIFFIPELVDLFRFKMFPSDGTEYLRKVLRIIIAQRGGFETKVTEPRDLLDILIKMKQESDKELQVTEDMILAQAALFLQAGFETSGLALTFIIYELAFCPEAQDKLYKELALAEDKHGEDLLDAGTLAQLPYLNCVIYEGLRKYPPLPALDRIALNDYVVDEHLSIKAGTPILVNAVGLHYDPDLYPEPEKFHPDRFLIDNQSKISAIFMPFGEGPRKCIGQRLGLTNLRHGLAAIMLNYEVKPLPNTPKPSEVKLDKRTVFISPGEILSVDFVPRKLFKLTNPANYNTCI